MSAPSVQHCTLMHTNEARTLLQAYQTLRKGNKTFSVYDLTVTLEWTGCWKETDSKVLLCATATCAGIMTYILAISLPLHIA